MVQPLRALLFCSLFSFLLYAQQPPVPPVRVYVEAIHGHKFVAGVDHPIPVPDAALHNQQMELAKTFLQRCPDVVPTVNRAKADYIVTLNWAPATRIFLGGKLIHKPDQIMLTSRDGDVLYSNVARSVGGDVDAVCRLINKRDAFGPTTPSLAPRKLDNSTGEAATQAAKDQQRINEVWDTSGSAGAADGPPPSRAAVAEEASRKEPNSPAHGDRAWLGASSADSPNLRHNGVTLSGVEQGGPADNAGLRAGDVILSMDGKYIYTVEELGAELRKRQPGSRVEIGFMRGTMMYKASVLLGKQARF